MKPSPEKLKSFEIRGLSRVGTGSITYDALHLGIGQGLQADRKVSLKISWDLAKAREEGRGLIIMGGKGGFLSLYDYFFVRFEDVAALMAPAMASTGTSFSPGQELAVLVTQFALGKELVKTEAVFGKPGKNLPSGSWLIEIDSTPYRQSLPDTFDSDKKVALLRNLIKLVKHAHDSEPAQVCGNIQPSSLLYDAAGSGDVQIVDWKGLVGFDAAAWKSPWHDETSELPKAADIHQLGLWVARLMGPEDRAWLKFAHSITKLRQAEAVPSIHAFDEAFNQIAESVSGRRYTRTLSLVSLCLLFLIGLGVWKYWQNYQLRPKISEIAHMRSEALKSEARANEVIVKLRKSLGDKDYAPVRDELIRCIGEIRFNYQVHHKFLQSIDWHKPSAIYLSQAINFAIYEGFAMEIGEPINEQEFIAQIRATGLVLASRETGKSRTMAFPKHPLLEDGEKDGQFIIYKADVWEINAALSNLVGQDINFHTFTQPRIYGLVLEDSPSLVLARISKYYKDQWVNDVFDERPEWIGLWDIEEGTHIKGTLGELANRFLVDKLELKVSGAHLLGKRIDQVVEYRMDCLAWFEQEAELSGVSMTLSKDGRNVSFF